VLLGNGLLDLLILGADPGIVDVAVGMQLGKGAEAFVGTAVVDEPTGGLGEEEDEKSKDTAGDDLDGQRQAPLQGVVVGEANKGTCKLLAMFCSASRRARLYPMRSRTRQGHQCPA
jgi:hypothetical protein